MPTALESLGEGGKFGPRQALEATPCGVGVHLQQEADVEKRGGDGGRKGDLGVGNGQERRHDEGGGAHHGRGQHAAGGRDRLDAAGVGGGKSRAFHRRDRDRSAGHDVRDHAAADRGLQRARHHGDVGRASTHRAHEGKGDIVEELRRAGELQRQPEDDEADDKIGECPHRHAENAFEAVEVVGRDIGDGQRHGIERARHVVGDGRVERDQQHDDRQRPAIGAARAFQHQEPGKPGDKLRLGRGRELPARIDDVVGVKDQVARAQAGEHEERAVKKADLSRGARRTRRDQEDDRKEHQRQHVKECLPVDNHADHAREQKGLVHRQQEAERGKGEYDPL